MQRFALSVAMLVALCVSREAKASAPASEDGRRAVVAVDLTGVRTASFYPIFEYAIGPRVSLLAQVAVGWSSSDGSALGYPDTHSLSLGGELGFNGFLTGRAPSGLWLGLRLGASRSSFGTGAGNIVNHEGSAAALLGYSKVFDSGVFLELAAGPSVSRMSGGLGLVGLAGLGGLTLLSGGGTTWSAGLRTVAALGFAF